MTFWNLSNSLICDLSARIVDNRSISIDRFRSAAIVNRVVAQQAVALCSLSVLRCDHGRFGFLHDLGLRLPSRGHAYPVRVRTHHQRSVSEYLRDVRGTAAARRPGETASGLQAMLQTWRGDDLASPHGSTLDSCSVAGNRGIIRGSGEIGAAVAVVNGIRPCRELTPTSPPPSGASCHRTLGPIPIATPSCSTIPKRDARGGVAGSPALGPKHTVSSAKVAVEPHRPPWGTS